MNKPLVVGLTGGIGSGKSSALREFKKRGCRILDLDAVAREQARKGGPAYAAVVKAFGKSILDPAGNIDRKALGRLVFSKPAQRRKLEAVTHPPILQEMSRTARNAKGVLVVDVPLLFEKGLEDRFDVTIAVTAPLETRVARVSRRDGLPAAQVRARARAQISDARRERLADVVLTNDRTPAAFRRAVAEYAAGLRLLQKGEQTVPK